MKRLFFIMVAIAIAVGSLAACGSSAPFDSVSLSPPSSSSQNHSEYFVLEGMPSSNNYFAPNSQSDGALPLPILSPYEAEGRKLIYTVTLQLQTTEFRAGMRKLIDTVNYSGGFMTSADVYGHDLRAEETNRRAHYEFRIPSARLVDFIMEAEDNFNMMRMILTTEDTTIQYDSADLRYDDLREQELRILTYLLDDLEASERLDLERRLHDIQTAINNLHTLQKTVEDDVLLSTVSIHLYEVLFSESGGGTQPYGERLNSRISRSVRAFVVFSQNLLLALIAVAPGIVVLLVIAAIVIIIVKASKKRRLKKKGEKESKEAKNDADK